MSDRQILGNLYTIGYSGFSIKHFIEIMKKFQIHCIIDVRSLPYSRQFPDYNKENLESLIHNKTIWNGAKVWYSNFKQEFGARQTNPRFLHENSRYVDFEKFRQSYEFLHGCKRVCNALKKGYNIVLMCAEIEPSICHRTIMIARWFDLNHYQVKHILPEMIKTQDDINNELLQSYFKDSYTNISMFGSLLYIDKSYEEMKKDQLIKAYQQRNKEIAFQINEEEY